MDAKSPLGVPVTVTRYSPDVAPAGTFKVALALPPDMLQVPATVIGAETATLHPVSTGLNPKPVTPTVTVPLIGGVMEFGEIVTSAVGVPSVKVVDADFPLLSVAVTTKLPAGNEDATVNVPET